MERIKDPNIERVIRSSIALSDVAHLGENGFAGEVLDGLSRQVSQMVNRYVADHPGEILRKSPEDIEKQFSSENSTIIVAQEFGDSTPTALCHVTMYETLSNEQVAALGCQVVEIGTVIAHPDFRGYGLGALATDRVMWAAQEKYGENTLCIATNKQVVATWSLNSGGGMVPVNFWDYPYLSHLTCVCESCSENFGYDSCEHRRSSENSTDSVFEALLQRGIPRKMDCTLVVDNIEAASQFELACRQVHKELGEEPLLSGPRSITIQSMQKAKCFFEHLGKM